MALAADVINKHPTKDTHAGSGIRVEGGHHGTNRGVERRAAVEAKPTEPDENSADEDERSVVGLSMDLFSLVDTFTEDKSIC